MAVSALEETQIGHYFQIKHDYAKAWRRYENALAAAPGVRSTPELDPKSATEWLGRLFSPRGFGVFQFQCLRRLGREVEARTALESFRRAYPPALPSERARQGEKAAAVLEFPLDQPWFRDAMQQGGLVARLLQDLYIAEVLLSLDASADARDYFRSITSRPAETETARLSAAVVLSQVLLLERKYDEYAALSTETLAPLLLELRRSLPAQSSSNALDLTRHVPDVVGALALLPLTSRTFVSGLSSAVVKSTTVRWETMRSQASDDLDRLAIDLVLEASYRHLGKAVERQQVIERIDRNPTVTSAGAGAGVVASLAHGITDETVETLRSVVSGTAPGMQTTGSRQ
jgi:hypothetical protein